MFENSDGFPFVVGGTPASVTAAHPTAIMIFQLWQIYISNVNPLLKITHTPTVQALIISASANPAKIPKDLEALMFAIYFAAITSLTEDEVHSTFGDDKAILLGRFHNATQQALVNAGFMRSNELMVLQALFLYLVLAPRFHSQAPCSVSLFSLRVFVLTALSSVLDHMSIPGPCSAFSGSHLG